MEPGTAITLASLAFKGLNWLKNRSKSRISNTGQTTASYQPGSYPPASTRGSTEREDERADYGSPYTPGPGSPAPPPGDESPGTPPAGGTTREDRDKLTWSNTGRMEGFEVGSTYGGDMKARNSVKNTFGRIASRYPATPEGLKQVVNDPDFVRFFPKAKLVPGGAGDKIDFGGTLSDFESGVPVYIVDVGNSFDPATNTGRGWWWGTEGEGGPSGSTPAGGSNLKWPTPDVPKTPEPRSDTSFPTATSKYRSNVTALTPEEIWNLPTRTLGSINRGY